MFSESPGRNQVDGLSSALHTEAARGHGVPAPSESMKSDIEISSFRCLSLNIACIISIEYLYNILKFCFM